MDLAKATAAFPLLPDSERFRFWHKSSGENYFLLRKLIVVPLSNLDKTSVKSVFILFLQVNSIQLVNFYHFMN